MTDTTLSLCQNQAKSKQQREWLKEMCTPIGLGSLFNIQDFQKK